MPIIKVTANTRDLPRSPEPSPAAFARHRPWRSGPSGNRRQSDGQGHVIARRFLSVEGITTACEPDMVILTIDEVERTAIRFTVSARDAPLVPHREETLP